VGSCFPYSKGCDITNPLKCNAVGKWEDNGDCAKLGCLDGICTAWVPVTASSTVGDYYISKIARFTTAPPGIYNLYAASGTAGRVALRNTVKDLVTITYNYKTTVGTYPGGTSYTFTFPGYFSVTVYKASGSSVTDLSKMDSSIFDGIHTISVL